MENKELQSTEAQAVGAEEKCAPLDLAKVEAAMLQQDGKIDIPVEHIFSAGVYIRQIAIPARTLIMGRRHRFETCNMLLKGVLAVYAEEGKPPIVITGPAIFTSKPFAKKFAYCLEDAVFANVIPTNKTDPDEIEKQWIIPEQEYLALKEEEKCLLSQ